MKISIVKNVKPRSLLCFLMMIALVFSLLPTLLLPANAATAGAFDITFTGGGGDPASGTDYTYSSNTLTIIKGGDYTIKMATPGDTTTTDRIVVASGVTADITIDGVLINVSGTQNVPAFRVAGATVNLTLVGTNTLRSGSSCAGLHVPSGASITIDGTGSLSATGGNAGAGIGGGQILTSNTYVAEQGGKITINGGTVVASGGGDGSGIGGGGAGYSTTLYNYNRGGDGGEITITGGNVTANGGPGGNQAGSGAGIGGGGGSAPTSQGGRGGDGGKITITGGTVRATGGSNGGAGIGGGWSIRGGSSGEGGTGGEITISGGIVTASGNTGAGIGGAYFGDGGEITISGGTVTATGNNQSAGIGGGAAGKGGETTISGGNVTATGNGIAAGIGGGNGGEGGKITISDGTVTANGGASGGAGIGSGFYRYGGVITISGGTVIAKGGATGGAGIGSARTGAGGDITISGGTVTATGGTGGGSGIGGGDGGAPATIDISATASIKAYSTGTLPAIHAANNNAGSAYFVNAIFSKTLSTAIAILDIHADDADPVPGTILLSLNLPASYRGFAYTIPTGSVYSSENEEIYNIYAYNTSKALLHGQVVRVFDDDVELYSVNELGGYDTYNPATPNECWLPVKLASWINTYTVTFVDGFGNTIGTQVVESGKAATAPSVPPRTGYIFNGWDKDFSNVTADMIVTAEWVLAEYNITYILNGGTNDPGNPSTYTILSPEITLQAPTKYGYTFSGWVEGGIIPAGSTGPMTFTATWSPDDYYITYILDDGDGTGENHLDNPASYTIEDATITLKDPSRDGYDFVWWEESGVENDTIPAGSTGNKTFTAIWKLSTPPQPTVYTVTVIESYAATTGAGSNYSAGDNVDIDAGSRTEYTFTGWTVDSGGVSLDDSGSATTSFKMPATDVIVTANWTLNEYTISYILDGGDNDTGNPDTYTYYSPMITLLDPSRDGYDFVQWEENGVENDTIPAGSTGNKTFTAIWKLSTPPQPTVYSVTVNGSYAATSGAGSYAEGDSVTIRAGSRTGYTFTGWTVNAGGVAIANAATTTFTMPANNVTVTANWSLNENGDPPIVIVTPTTTVTPEVTDPPEITDPPEEDTPELIETPQVRETPEPITVPEIQEPLAEEPPPAPPPTIEGNTLEPTDDGTFIEFGDDGVPLEEWRWNEVIEEWVFEEYPPPLGALPQTGLYDNLANLLAILGLTLTAAGLALIPRKKKGV